MIDQAQKLTLSSRAFHSAPFSDFARRMSQEFGYDKVLPTNSGAEAVETAIKLARKWAYKVKKVAPDQAIVLAATENFHGRTMGVVSMSTDTEATANYGPLLPRVGPTCPATGAQIRFSNIADLEAALDRHGAQTAAFLVEPIQGEAGFVAEYIPFSLLRLPPLVSSCLQKTISRKSPTYVSSTMSS